MLTDDNGDIASTMKMLKTISLNPLIDGINSSEYTSLRILNSLISRSGSNSVYVSDITKELNISAPSVSKLLKGLEKKGLVIREVDKNSRRKTFVYITEKGIKTKEKNDYILKEFAKHIYVKLGAERIEEFQHLATDIYGAVVDEIKLFEAKKKDTEVGT